MTGETLCGCSQRAFNVRTGVERCPMCQTDTRPIRETLAQVYEPMRVALMSDEQVVREYRQVLGDIDAAMGEQR